MPLRSGGFRNYRRGGTRGVWGTGVFQLGPGAKPSEADDIFWNQLAYIANIISFDRCIKLELTVLTEWIKIVLYTVSVFSLFYPSSCDVHRRWGWAASLNPLLPLCGCSSDCGCCSEWHSLWSVAEWIWGLLWNTCRCGRRIICECCGVSSMCCLGCSSLGCSVRFQQWESVPWRQNDASCTRSPATGRYIPYLAAYSV